MYMTRVNMVGDKEKCRLSPFFNFFSILFLNDGTTANTKPGSDKDCMLQLLDWFSEVTRLVSLVIFQRDNYAVFFSFAIL